MSEKQHQEEAQQVGSQFVRYYYNLFDTDRQQLQNLYTPESLLYWHGEVCRGSTQISSGITNLPFNKIVHVITTDDHQLTPQNYILSMVIGQLQMDSNRPVNFHETFLLKKESQSWMLINQAFRFTS
uniref:Nuclear transport factor 2 n=1 Tax=Periophthalmus magnuspinnatus TaxID=409849 RepID=A0A3B4A5D3_9GOBI